MRATYSIGPVPDVPTLCLNLAIFPGRLLKTALGGHSFGLWASRNVRIRLTRVQNRITGRITPVDVNARVQTVGKVRNCRMLHTESGRDPVQ